MHGQNHIKYETKLLRNTGHTYKTFNVSTDIPERKISHLRATGRLKYFIQIYPRGKDLIFTKDFGLCEISEHKEFELKCVNVTLSKTRKSLKLFQNVLLEN